MAKKTNKTNKNVNEKEIKEMKAANNKPMDFKALPKHSSLFTMEDLLTFINSVHYTQDITITGVCDVVIERYETGVSVKHTDGTFVYSMRTDNPEKDDIQPDDACEGYIKLWMRVMQDDVVERTTTIVRESGFGKFATALIHWAADGSVENPTTLRALLDAVIKYEEKICIERVCEADEKGSKYCYYNWSKFTHQPRYKTDYVLNSAVNLGLFEHTLDTNLYYRMPEYGQTYAVKLDDFFIRTVKKWDKKLKAYVDCPHLGLKLVNDDFIYIIDTDFEFTVKQIAKSLILAKGFAIYDNLEQVLVAIKGEHFLFTPLDETTDSGTTYEIFAFGKGVN